MTDESPRATIKGKPHRPLPNQREHLYSGWLYEYRVPMHNRTVSGVAVTWAMAMLCVQQALTGKR
jgi:hypothetical protein